jgi:hypothetical protein
MERFAIVMPTFSASSVTLIFRFANMTSMFIMIAILVSLYGICLNSVHRGEVWRGGSPSKKNSLHCFLTDSVLHCYILLGFYIHGMLQYLFKHRRRGGDYDRDKNHKQAHSNAARNVILAAHSYE